MLSPLRGEPRARSKSGVPMKRFYPACLVLWLGVVALRAGPTEDAVIALMRLGDQSSYTWVATISDDARTYDIDGKTDQAGYSRVKMPMINAIRRRLGRDVTDSQAEAIFLGTTTCVLQTPLGWFRPENLPEAHVLADHERGSGGASTVAVSGKGILSLPGLPSLPGGASKSKEPRAYSNLQLALSPPHEELAVIVSSHLDFKVEGDVVTGTFTELGARLLLVRDGQPNITPIKAAGEFKVWLRGGLPIRYQTDLRGTLGVASDKGHVQVGVQQRTFTVISNVGTTEVDIPEQAKLALAQ